MIVECLNSGLGLGRVQHGMVAVNNTYLHALRNFEQRYRDGARVRLRSANMPLLRFGLGLVPRARGCCSGNVCTAKTSSEALASFPVGHNRHVYL